MSIPTEDCYQTQSAILFIIFNRLDTSLQVLKQIRNTKPARLYITADGPRTYKSAEDLRCQETKAMIMAGIDWDCEVNTLFRDENKGPKEAIASAVAWFFEHEEEGIILEHDCLPNNSFFKFCDTLLEKYRFDNRVWLISGCNLQNGKKWGNASYYFSNLTNGWGWATWRRSWNTYDKDLIKYNDEEVRENLQNIFDDPLIVDSWENIFKDTKSGKIDTWDYQVTFAHFFNNCVNIVPNSNLVSNIGFGVGAENTIDGDSFFANIPLIEMGEIIHPQCMLPQKQADLYTLNYFFDVEKRRYKQNLLRRRFKKWLIGKIKP